MISRIISIFIIQVFLITSLGVKDGVALAPTHASLSKLTTESAEKVLSVKKAVEIKDKSIRVVKNIPKVFISEELPKKDKVKRISIASIFVAGVCVSILGTSLLFTGVFITIPSLIYGAVFILTAGVLFSLVSGVYGGYQIYINKKEAKKLKEAKEAAEAQRLREEEVKKKAEEKRKKAEVERLRKEAEEKKKQEEEKARLEADAKKKAEEEKRKQQEVAKKEAAKKIAEEEKKEQEEKQRLEKERKLVEQAKLLELQKQEKEKIEKELAEKRKKELREREARLEQERRNVLEEKRKKELEKKRLEEEAIRIEEQKVGAQAKEIEGDISLAASIGGALAGAASFTWGFVSSLVNFDQNIDVEGSLSLGNALIQSEMPNDGQLVLDDQVDAILESDVIEPQIGDSFLLGSEDINPLIPSANNAMVVSGYDFDDQQRDIISSLEVVDDLSVSFEGMQVEQPLLLGAEVVNPLIPSANNTMVVSGYDFETVSKLPSETVTAGGSLLTTALGVSAGVAVAGLAGYYAYKKYKDSKGFSQSVKNDYNWMVNGVKGLWNKKLEPVVIGVGFKQKKEESKGKQSELLKTKAELLKAIRVLVKSYDNRIEGLQHKYDVCIENKESIDISTVKQFNLTISDVRTEIEKLYLEIENNKQLEENEKTKFKSSLVSLYKNATDSAIEYYVYVISFIENCLKEEDVDLGQLTAILSSSQRIINFLDNKAEDFLDRNICSEEEKQVFVDRLKAVQEQALELGKRFDNNLGDDGEIDFIEYGLETIDKKITKETKCLINDIDKIELYNQELKELEKEIKNRKYIILEDKEAFLNRIIVMQSILLYDKKFSEIMIYVNSIYNSLEKKSFDINVSKEMEKLEDLNARCNELKVEILENSRLSVDVKNRLLGDLLQIVVKSIKDQKENVKEIKAEKKLKEIKFNIEKLKEKENRSNYKLEELKVVRERIFEIEEELKELETVQNREEIRKIQALLNILRYKMDVRFNDIEFKRVIKINMSKILSLQGVNDVAMQFQNIFVEYMRIANNLKELTVFDEDFSKVLQDKIDYMNVKIKSRLLARKSELAELEKQRKEREEIEALKKDSSLDGNTTSYFKLNKNTKIELIEKTNWKDVIGISKQELKNDLNKLKQTEEMWIIKKDETEDYAPIKIKDIAGEVESSIDLVEFRFDSSLKNAANHKWVNGRLVVSIHPKFALSMESNEEAKNHLKALVLNEVMHEVVESWHDGFILKNGDKIDFEETSKERFFKEKETIKLQLALLATMYGKDGLKEIKEAYEYMELEKGVEWLREVLEGKGKQAFIYIEQLDLLINEINNKITSDITVSDLPTVKDIVQQSDEAILGTLLSMRNA